MFSNEITVQPTPVDAKMPPLRTKPTGDGGRFDYLNYGKDAADESEDNYEDDADFAPMPIVDNGFDDY